jgi:hypothetical protein
MGDRFYMQQKNYKPKRRLKADVIAEIDILLNEHVEGLDKCTIATLDALASAILSSQNAKVLDFAARAATGE